MIAISPTAPITMPTIAPVLRFEDEVLDEDGLVNPAVLGVLVLDWEDCSPYVAEVGEPD